MVSCSPRAPGFYPKQYVRAFNQNLGSPLIYFICTPFNKNVWSSFILSLCTSIQSKIRVLINLLFLFVHNHSTKAFCVTVFLFLARLTNWSKIQKFPLFWKTAQIWSNFFRKLINPMYHHYYILLKTGWRNYFLAKSFFILPWLPKIFKMVQIS